MVEASEIRSVIRFISNSGASEPETCQTGEVMNVGDVGVGELHACEAELAEEQKAIWFCKDWEIASTTSDDPGERETHRGVHLAPPG